MGNMIVEAAESALSGTTEYGVKTVHVVKNADGQTTLVVWRGDMFTAVNLTEAERVDLIESLGGSVAPF